MNRFTSWLQQLLTNLWSKIRSNPPDLQPSKTATLNEPGYNKAFYANYYSLIASGVRLKLVEAMFRLDFFSFFTENNCVLEQDLIDKLGLVPLRAQKWLHLLCCEHFLEKVCVDKQPGYQLPQQLYDLLHSDNWWGLEFFYNKWAKTSQIDLTEVLQDKNEKLTPWVWPPNTKEQALWIETWMTKTVEKPLKCILDHIDFTPIQSYLDVGGGDGTIACALVTTYPHLKATVYNLPHSLELAQENIDARDLSPRIQLYEGNFIQDTTFPSGHDLVLFSRVLMDWGIDTSKKLLKMAYEALEEGGLVVICEHFRDEHHDTCLSCEYSYIFYDNIDIHVMKSIKKYQLMLTEIGFTIIQPTLIPKFAHPYCSLILARKM